MRSPIQFHETVGAVHDTLAQIHLIQGNYEASRECLERAREAYGAYGRQTSQWYDWSVRVLLARLAQRRGALDEAVTLADETIAAGAPPFDALQATLIAGEALAGAGRLDEAETRLKTAADQLDPRIGTGHLGRVPAAARHAARTPGASLRGVPRLRAERDAARSARRAIPGGIEPSRDRTSRRADRSARDRRSVISTRPRPSSRSCARRAILPTPTPRAAC